VRLASPRSGPRKHRTWRGLTLDLVVSTAFVPEIAMGIIPMPSAAFHEFVTALDHQPSTNGRFFPVRGDGGGTELRPDITHVRVSAGSITLSSSNSEAVLSALPRSYIWAT